MPDPNTCGDAMPALGHGTGQLLVDGVDVGNIVILDIAGEGDNIPMFRPAVEAPLDNNPYSLSFERSVTIEGTLDHLTLANLELVLKTTGTLTADGYRLPFAYIREEPMHTVELYLDVGCDADGCDDVLYTLIRRAFVELPWTLPWRRESWTEFVVRFIALPDAGFPESPYGYLAQLCPQAAS
jgi:hypothetical protein